jgi:hypothetical protein
MEVCLQMEHRVRKASRYLTAQKEVSRSCVIRVGRRAKTVAKLPAHAKKTCSAVKVAIAVAVAASGSFPAKVQLHLTVLFERLRLHFTLHF